MSFIPKSNSNTEETKMEVIIMRGLPGSGKSTWLKTRKWECATPFLCSADTYHINKDGKYDYKPENAKAAHEYCFRQYLSILMRLNSQYTHLLVDNTNTTIWEIAPYYRVAEVVNGRVEIIQIDCPVEVALKRNIHQVPSSTIWKMHQNLLQERLPPHWKHEVIPATFALEVERTHA